MGLCQSSATDEAETKKKSQAIDRALEEDLKNLRRECKILLLGACRHICVISCSTSDKLTGSGESGKSTIVKQMKIIHQNGYTIDELTLYRHTIYKNLLDCAKALVTAMEQFEIESENKNVTEMRNFVTEYMLEPDPEAKISPDIGEAVSVIWDDPSKDKVLEHSTEFYLMDSAP